MKTQSLIKASLLMIFLHLILFLNLLGQESVSANPTRPSAADNAYLTQRGYAELEIGWLNQDRFWSVPALLKFTPFSKVELGFLNSGLVTHSRLDERSETSLGDFGLQVKGQLMDSGSFATALLGRSEFPSEEKPKYTVLSASSVHTRHVQIDFTVGGVFSMEQAESYQTSLFYALAISPKWNSRFRGFAEIYGKNTSDSSPLYFDVGVSYTVRPSLVLDVSLTIGLTDSAQDWVFQAGVTAVLFKVLK